MSNVSNVHDVVVYDAKATKPYQGQRLAKVLYKTPKDGSVKPENKAVSIPVIAMISSIAIHFTASVQ